MQENKQKDITKFLKPSWVDTHMYTEYFVEYIALRRVYFHQN